MSCRPRHFWPAGVLDPSVQVWMQYDLPPRSAQTPFVGQSAVLLHVLVHNPPCGAAPLMPRFAVSRHVSGPQAASDVHGRPSCAAPCTGPPLEEEVVDELLDALVLLLLDAALLLLDALDDETCAGMPPAPPIPPVPGLLGVPQAVDKEASAPRTRRDRKSSALLMHRTLHGFIHARKVDTERARSPDASASSCRMRAVRSAPARQHR
jgi:hypothetical protein